MTVFHDYSHTRYEILGHRGQHRPERRLLMLSFWLMGNLLYTGQMDRAFDYFNEMITRCSNHQGRGQRGE